MTSEKDAVPLLHPGVKSSIQGFDKDSLYVVEIYSDLVNGDIKMATPVNAGRTRDSRRDARFFSSITVNYRGQAMNVNFEIDAKNLEEAIDKFPETAQARGSEMVEKLEAMDRRANILMPTATIQKPN